MAIDNLVGVSDYKIQQFRDLDPGAQAALIWHMAVDSEQWELLGTLEDDVMSAGSGLRGAIEQSRHLYVDEYGDAPIGDAAVPSDRMKAALLANLGVAGSWETDKQRRHEAGAQPGQVLDIDRWPAILSHLSDEVLDAGFESCIACLDAGEEFVPALFMPEREHMLAWERASNPAIKKMASAIDRNDAGAVHRLLGEGFQIDLIVDDKIGEAIHYAARHGRAAICALLLESGADVNAEGVDGCHPLAAATASGSVETVRIFVEAGADIEGAVGSGLWHAAIASGNCAMVDMIIKAGADVEALDDMGESPLIVAVKRSEVAICAQLLEAGASANAHNVRSKAALSAAVLLGHPIIVESLIRYGADVRLLDTMSLFQLNRTADNPADPERGGQAAAIALLREVWRGGPHYVIDGATSRYLTPFEHAVRRGKTAYVSEILGAEPDLDVDQRTRSGKTLLELAGDNGEMKALLLSQQTARNVSSGLLMPQGAEAAPACRSMGPI